MSTISSQCGKAFHVFLCLVLQWLQGWDQIGLTKTQNKTHIQRLYNFVLMYKYCMYCLMYSEKRLSGFQHTWFFNLNVDSNRCSNFSSCSVNLLLRAAPACFPCTIYNCSSCSSYHGACKEILIHILG